MNTSFSSSSPTLSVFLPYLTLLTRPTLLTSYSTSYLTLPTSLSTLYPLSLLISTSAMPPSLSPPPHLDQRHVPALHPQRCLVHLQHLGRQALGMMPCAAVGHLADLCGGGDSAGLRAEGRGRGGSGADISHYSSHPDNSLATHMPPQLHILTFCCRIFRHIFDVFIISGTVPREFRPLFFFL